MRVTVWEVEGWQKMFMGDKGAAIEEGRAGVVAKGQCRWKGEVEGSRSTRVGICQRSLSKHYLN